MSQRVPPIAISRARRARPHGGLVNALSLRAGRAGIIATRVISMQSTIHSN